MATWSNLNYQNSASPLMEQIIFFHDHSLVILIMITILVSYLMINLFFNSYINRFLCSCTCTDIQSLYLNLNYISIKAMIIS